MENIKHLYIIGNGFDIHHCRKTSYSEFYRWALENHEDVIEEIEEKIGDLDAKWWSNFENNLANIDAYTVSQTIASENDPDLLDDHVDRHWDDAKVYTEQLFEEVYDEIKTIFEEWIQQGIAPTKSECLISLNRKDSFFLTFNYTDTLEESYHVSPSQILHIHGSIYDKKFIIGHGKSEKEITNENKYNDSRSVNKGSIEDDEDFYDDEEEDIYDNEEEDIYDDEEEDFYEDEEEGLELHQQWALDAAISSIASQRKPVTNIIKNNNDIFCSFKDVTDIHIYGFSFSDIDLPYLDKIVEVIDLKNVSWEISDFEDKNKEAIQKFLNKHGISNYKIISLEDKIPESGQLELFDTYDTF